MSEWKKVRLGELCDFINGGAWSDKEYAPEGIPVLKVTNCKNSGFSLSELSYLPHSLEQKYIQNKLQRNDVIIATVGSHPNLVNSSAGRSVIVNSFVEGFYLNQNAVCIRTKDEEILDQLFWGYYSKYYLFQNYIQMRGKGAANQMRIAISAIKNYPMPLPPINVQRHIASILSRYDSLIENYQKQIKLLEEAARRLYKEWFIDLHFPGHENTKIVDGVPEGWEKKKVGEIAPIITGKKDANFGTPNGEYPFFTCSQEPIKAPSFSFDCAAVLLAGNGDFNVKLYRGRFEAYQRTYVLSPYIDSHLYLLFYTISANMTKLAAGSSGSTIKFLTKGMIDGINLNVPNDEILRSFNKKVEPIQSSRESLQSQLRLLTEARDRLLPKLMSGEITI